MRLNIMKIEKHAILYLLTTVYILTNHRCSSNTTSVDPDDPREMLYRELSTDTYFSLPFHDPGDTADTFKKQYRRQEDDHPGMEDFEWVELDKYHNSPSLDGPAAPVDNHFEYVAYQYNKSLDTLNPDAVTTFHLCYSVSYIWRRGRKGIHRYYAMRDTYYNHLPFEIGYITQTIMAKYQNVLEVFEFSTRMEKEQKLGRPHLFFFYKNVLEDCRTIIHLCNMMHEVTRKYRVQQYSHRDRSWINVKYDPSAKFQDFVPRPPQEFKDITEHPERGIEGLEHEKFRHEDPAKFERIKQAGTLIQKEKERQYKLGKPQKNYFMDHARFSITSPTTRRTRRWRPNEPLIYGWEPENT